MKTDKKKPRNDSFSDDEFVKKPVKKTDAKRDKKPRIYDVDDEEDLPDFNDLLDDSIAFSDEEDDY